jgi:DNA-binding IclR family transcriptional regulator
MDSIDERLLQLVNDRASIQEMAEDCNISVGWVHQRLESLQEQGLVEAPPKPNQPRSRKLTSWGNAYLQKAGYKKIQLFEEDDNWQWR